MGREILCRAKFGGKWQEGKALLETTEIIFRGEARLKVPFSEITSIAAHDGKLHLQWSGDSAVLELGEPAEKWAHAILHPKSTIEKLGVKPGMKLSAVGMPVDSTMKDAQKAAASFSRAKPLRDSDIIFFGIDSPVALSGLRKLISSLSANGSIWVVYPKGRKEITELRVLQAGRAAGLYDVKVVSYSATLTALKFVRPKDKR
jgi:hypothetical protein